ncbi:LuxR C-terminal-related transcriptional regulator [Actinomycetospora aeridis]|uniref:LuxR C-terminal-related transcriptional regulator n=1 Tax=Actinomycetospora aeridis TaxID=3129231 RepID=A0ABU8NF46_9PSEU
MSAERTLTAALDLAAATATVRTPADLDSRVWPALAALAGAGSVAVTGFDGHALTWPCGTPSGTRHRALLVLRRRGAEARVVLHRAVRDFSDRDVALLHLVRPHLADALWRAAHGPPARALTAREQAVVARVARGATDAAIAHELGISRRTVGKHLENAYAALGVHDRTSAALRLAVPPA